MGLKTKKNNDFKATTRDPVIHGANVVYVKGGSTVVEDRWVHYNDLRVDVQSVVSKYVNSTSRRLFNKFGDVIYVLIVRDKYGTLEVVPSLAYKKKRYGNIKVFPDLSGKVPLILVRLTQDGSSGLTGIRDIVDSDVEVYRGYGNFTLRGMYGASGLAGFTGRQGVTGYDGFRGYAGVTGVGGLTGALGDVLQGETGSRGSDGTAQPPYIVIEPGYIQDVVDESQDTWQDIIDDNQDTIQDTP
ncbi:MAG: hypothetical protein GF334_00155 [Candidatus Altiarchaeales archaeon]|nr:hypothetical protein [Candidatus Altiarchaeales archaeon]